METKEVNKFIADIELFKGLSTQELTTVATAVEEKVFKTGEYLFYENSPREVIYIIYEGEVELFKKSPFGAETRLSYFSRYDFLGEGSLTEDSPHSTSARVKQKTKVL